MARTSSQKKRGVAVLSVVERPKQPKRIREIARRSELMRANAKLRTLIDHGEYDLAKILFTEMVKSSKYSLANLWKVGAEIIGKTSPGDLADYLKAVYISSPQLESVFTFNAYIDQLMIEKKWILAIEEMELLYSRTIYHHPIILRKLAICSYRSWEIAKTSVPESYFEEDMHDPYDTTIVRYEKFKKLSSKYLEETHKHYPRDVETLSYYCTFLQVTENEETKKAVILKSLEEFKQDPDYFLLYYLLKVNEQDKYFSRKPFILHLYECDPLLPAGDDLRTYVRTTCKRIDALMTEHNIDEKEKEKYQKRAERLFLLFINRVEHGNFEIWFLKRLRESVFEHGLNREICEIYRSRRVDRLLRMSYHVHDQHPEFVIEIADDLQALVEAFLEENKTSDMDQAHIPGLDELSRFNQLQEHVFSQI